MNFRTAVGLFDSDDIRKLASTERGLLFLKLRSLSRKDYMGRLMERQGISAGGAKSDKWLEMIYDSGIGMADVDAAISEFYDQDRNIRKQKEDILLNELYSVESFGWGGLHQNSLERTIVDKYVKKINSYKDLLSAIENRIHDSMRAYVLASWYNHWTSIIIEDIFKDHGKVVPAIGFVKKIDFFINDKPYDLKVTYFPEGYIKECRKARGMRPELTEMKVLCRRLAVGYDTSLPDSALMPHLWRKLDDHPDGQASDLINDLQGIREALLNEAMADPEPLLRWLYENQGSRRFDASNRLFLILVDKGDFFASWRLKRAKPLLSESVNRHLDDMGDETGFRLDFDWKGSRYTADSDVIFVVKG